MIQIHDPNNPDLGWSKFNESDKYHLNWFQEGILRKKNNLQFVNIIFARIFDEFDMEIKVGYKNNLANCHIEEGQIVQDYVGLNTVKILIKEKNTFLTAFPVADSDFQIWAAQNSKNMILGRKVAYLMAKEKVKELQEILLHKAQNNKDDASQMGSGGNNPTQTMGMENKKGKYKMPQRLGAKSLQREQEVTEETNNIKKQRTNQGKEQNAMVFPPKKKPALTLDARFMGSNYYRNTRRICPHQGTLMFFFLQGKCREDRDSCNSKNNDLFGKEFEHSDGKGDPYGYNSHLHDYNKSIDSDSNSSGEYRKYTEEEQKYVCQWVQNKRFKKFQDSVQCGKDTFGRDNSGDKGECTGQMCEHDNGRGLKHIIKHSGVRKSNRNKDESKGREYRYNEQNIIKRKEEGCIKKWSGVSKERKENKGSQRKEPRE